MYGVRHLMRVSIGIAVLALAAACGDSTSISTGRPFVEVVAVDGFTPPGVFPGDSIQFVSTAYDLDLKPIPGEPIAWQVRRPDEVHHHIFGCPSEHHIDIPSCRGYRAYLSRPDEPPPAPETLPGTIDDRGMFHAIRPGSAAILAKAGTVMGFSEVVVLPPFPFVGGTWDFVTTVPAADGGTHKGTFTIVDTVRAPTADHRDVWVSAVSRYCRFFCSTGVYPTVKAGLTPSGRIIYTQLHAEFDLVFTGDSLSGTIRFLTSRVPPRTTIAGHRR